MQNCIAPIRGRTQASSHGETATLLCPTLGAAFLQYLQGAFLLAKEALKNTPAAPQVRKPPSMSRPPPQTDGELC